MKVESSAYLSGAKPVLAKLIAALSDYEYASVLATDNRAKEYSVSARGISASEDPEYTNRGFVLRVKDADGYAEYSFNEISEESIPAIVKKVRGELLPIAENLPENIGRMERKAPAEEKTVFTGASEYEIHPDSLGTEGILSKLQEIRTLGLSKDERLMDCSVGFNYQEIHKLFLSKDKDLEQNIMWSCGRVGFMAAKGQEIKSSGEGYSNFGGAELLAEMTRDIDRSLKDTIDLLSAEPMVPGEYECVCTPSVTGMIVHEAFGHGVEMDMFVKDRALAKYVVGEYVASPLVTMHDGACSIEDTGSYFFDDEGNMAHDTIIIDKGILKTGMADELSAESLGIPATGNGRRESFERKSYTRMTNTYFEGGSDKPEDMIASVKDGFLLDKPSSGMEDPKNWGIQCMVSIAREIKDGKLTGRIFSPVVLSGYVPDLLKSISMVSETMEHSGTGFCGKGYKEWVKVSTGGPWIKANIRLG